MKAEQHLADRADPKSPCLAINRNKAPFAKRIECDIDQAMSLSLFRLTAAMVLGFAVANLPAAFAASGQMNKPPPRWNWLNEDDKKNLLQSIPPAPTLGSALDQQDVQGVLKLQATRTPQDIAEALSDKNFRLEIVARPLGPSFTKTDYPVTFALLDRVNEDEYLLNSTLKKEYKRLRPFQSHPEVKALFTRRTRCSTAPQP
jgi:hypothetical protein